MGAACQEPLGTCFLINALSDGVSTTQRPVQAKRGKERLSPRCRTPDLVPACWLRTSRNLVHPVPEMWEGASKGYFSLACSGFRLWFPLPVFEGFLFSERISGCPPPTFPRLAPPAIVTHELLINLGNRKDITVVCFDLPLLWWISVNTKQICICMQMIIWDIFQIRWRSALVCMRMHWIHVTCWFLYCNLSNCSKDPFCYQCRLIVWLVYSTYIHYLTHYLPKGVRRVHWVYAT